MIRRVAALSLLAFLATAVFAQNAPSNKKDADDIGWTSTASFEGSANSQERVLDLGSNVGYNFNEHWGVDMGVPLSFVSSSTPTTTTGTTTTKGTSSSLNSLGNVYMDAKFKTTGDVANYNSTLTVAAPTGSTTKGVSTGRPNYGWNNHVEHGFDRLTPFLELGLSNGLTDTKFFHRPFTTLGFVSQFTGGSKIDLGGNFSIGGSLYDVLPSGQQKMYSKLVAKKSTTTAGAGKYGRAFELAAVTSGDASLTRDNGGSAWVEFSPGKIFDFQIGYTHSVHFALDTVAFSMEVNLGKLMKRADRF
ncbi:MAG TPA: hypothetical protein VNX88_08565 [Terriglobales bacterium]|jgi:hypothetical protein|nr:hypothetical protein [Terriglobales bacterium]